MGLRPPSPWPTRVAAFGVIVAAFASPAAAQGRCGPIGQDAMHACLYPGDGPTVVLAAGAGQDSRTWNVILEELTDVAAVVTFDRPGLGRSPPVPGPRTPTAIARELHDVLTELGVTGPIVLVGHSMGGVHALRYAGLYPDAVGGVVLIDTPPAGFEEARLELLSQAARQERLRTLAEGRARAPEVVGRERDGAASEPREFSALPDGTPLVVVVATGQYFGELGSPDEHRRLWSTMSEAWLELSAQSELVRAEGAGHMVHHQRPQLVLSVIREVVAWSR